MQWLVQIALKRPYTFVVLAILIIFLGAVTCVITPKDVFPSIDIPVVSVIWSYGGLSPNDMEKRIITISERASTTTVNDIEHIESQSLYGVGVIKVFFHPTANIASAVAQVTSIMQTLLRAFPSGTTPPLIIQSNASSVPILQLGLDSDSLTEQQLYDLGTQFIRTGLSTVQGASIPLPYGGKARQVMVDIDLDALHAKGLTPLDVSNTISAQNLILPAGTAKMGTIEYQVRVNSSPPTVDEINNMPIRSIDNSEVYIRDVAQARDGFAVQTNSVSINGRPAALLVVLKSGKASTLDVIERLRKRLPSVQATLPPSLNIRQLFDQSLFVRASIDGVMREAIIAAVLTALMILLFLGSWRSTLIVITTIPLAILTSICLLGLMGETLNIMTLGGLALAVGILVDDATVEIENVHRNIDMNKGIRTAILDGAAQIATPTLVSTLSICVVFISVVFLTGPAKYLFTPMALAVVFAMLASYMLSRTVIPNLMRSLLHAEIGKEPPNNLLGKAHKKFEHYFDKLKDSYSGLLERGLNSIKLLIALFVIFFLISCCLYPFVGEDFFPTVDAGQFRLHVRTPPGTRIEETVRRFHEVEAELRKIIPDDCDIVMDNIGIPVGGVNLAFTDSAVIGPNDGEILVSLKAGHKPTASYMAEIRDVIPHKFPDMLFYFQPGDIVNQILNFGIPAPIDIQVVGRDPGNYKLAQDISRDVTLVQGAVDVHVHEIVNQPSLDVDVDRVKAQQLGFQQKDVANALLTALSGSGQASPNYWLDPTNGVSYLIAVQTPPDQIPNIEALMKTPINVPQTTSVVNATTSGQDSIQLLSNVASLSRGTMAENINHYNVQPTYDIYANVQNRDLGGVSSDINKILENYRKHAPKGTQITVRGQVQSMHDSFVRLGLGILFAITLVYLLMVVNFQSWIDPLIIIMALPGALSGILWMLFLTRTTISVPSLMGTIMCVGLSVANSILMVTFANERRDEGDDAFEAALQAGKVRLRPVMMTALAMIIGMIPMSLGLGEGGEQNAPLGRAVIGGLLVATFSTLFLVPAMYTILRKKPQEDLDPPDEPREDDEKDGESKPQGGKNV